LVRTFLHIWVSDQGLINGNLGNLASASQFRGAEEREVIEILIVRAQALERIAIYLEDRSIHLILYAAPYNNLVEEAYANPWNWENAINLESNNIGKFYDYRKSVRDPRSFTDILHTNITGERIVTSELEKIISKIWGHGQ